MGCYLGLDTSNYTTSAALYDAVSGCIRQEKMLLAVKNGALGLRQSDAVFSHVKQLGGIIQKLMEGKSAPLCGVGVSVRPRDVDGSYMPCFLVGQMAAQAVSAAMALPLSSFSHQSGHIAAALFSSGKLDLIGQKFVAFHLSGGTTEYLLVQPDAEHVFSVSLIGRSLDLKAGQAIDRVGGMLGLPFPAGVHLERLAADSQKHYRVRAVMRGRDCSLSGIENKCQKMIADGQERCDIAKFCLERIFAAVEQMTLAAKDAVGDLPVVYSGGVMSNAMIRERITAKYGGYFAQPAFSSDNAAGVAVLAAYVQSGGGK